MYRGRGVHCTVQQTMQLRCTHNPNATQPHTVRMRLTIKSNQPRCLKLHVHALHDGTAVPKNSCILRNTNTPFVQQFVYCRTNKIGNKEPQHSHRISSVVLVSHGGQHLLLIADFAHAISPVNTNNQSCKYQQNQPAAAFKSCSVTADHD